MKNNTIAITGATGFLGKNLTLSLCNDGLNVHAFSRSKKNIFTNNLVSWFSGSLNQRNIIEELISGCDTVIHVAGATKVKSSVDFYTINRDLTKEIVSVCKEKKIKRLIYISSLAAREPSLSHYSLSKKQAEDLLGEYRSFMDIVIIRPPVIYGPGDREVSALFKMVLRGLVFAPNDKNNRISMIHVDDLCCAIKQCIITKQVNVPIEIDDGKPGGYSWAELVEVASDVLSCEAKVIYIPSIFIWILGFFGTLRSFLFSPIILTLAKVPEILHSNWVVEGEKLELWSSEKSLQKGFNETVKWCRSQNIIKSFD